MPRVVMYTRSWCGHCRRAKLLLESKGVAFEEIELEREPERVAEMVQRAGGRHTVPQIFIGERHVGGASDLARLDAQGRLDAMLRDETRGEADSGKA